MSKRTLKATPNFNKRTFTLRINYETGAKETKYRTVRLSRNEFESCLNNTQNDWFNFLKSDDYYHVS